MKQNLLNKYEQYDYLNKEENLVKILVSYIKPSFLFRSKILTPIHLGKAVEKENSKDGIQSESDLKWLHENCEFNDEFNGGISKHNRRIGFLTGTFWAWKNYKKLGNPKYIGSFGYRKLLDPICLREIQKYDIIAPKKQFFNETLKEQFSFYHGMKAFNAIIETFGILYPEERDAIEKYFNQKSGYFHEMYIMKKD